MFWSYVGGGCWEWQGCGLLLGCVYGNKFDERVRLAVEQVVRDEVSEKQAVRHLWATETVEMDLDEAQMLVEAHMERIVRDELSRLNVGAQRFS